MGRWPRSVIALAAGAVLLAVGMIAGRDGGGAPRPAPTGTSSAAPRGFTTVEDRAAHFKIAFPSGWQRLDHPDDAVRVIATPNGRDSFLVRVSPLPEDVNPSDVPGAKPALDRLLEGADIEIRDARQVTLAGVPGWFYLYTFVDPESKEQGVHSHYFLFNRSDLVTIVFQALPTGRFEQLATTFDAIAATFRPLS